MRLLVRRLVVSASKVSATAVRGKKRNLVPLEAIGIAASVESFVMQFDAG